MTAYAMLKSAAMTRALNPFAVKVTSSTTICNNQGIQLLCQQRSVSRINGGQSKMGYLLQRNFVLRCERMTFSSVSSRMHFGGDKEVVKQVSERGIKSCSSKPKTFIRHHYHKRHLNVLLLAGKVRANGGFLVPSTISKFSLTRYSHNRSLYCGLRPYSHHHSSKPLHKSKSKRILLSSLTNEQRNLPGNGLLMPMLSSNTRCLSSTSTSTYMSWRKRMKRMKRSTDTFMTTPIFPWWSDETSPSHILVHLTFLLTGCAYMSNDMFQLRCVATCSITISVIVLTFMPKVPKTPLLWNAFYLLINLAWCTLIFYERYEASRMDDEFEAIYTEGRFEERGFDRVEFRRLFLRGIRKEFTAGHYLKEVNRRDPELVYLAKGGVRVCKEGKVLRQYKKGIFIGEVSFLPYLTGETKQIGKSSADVIVQPGGLVAYVWNTRKLRDFLRNDRQTRNAVLAFVSHDLREKLMTTSNQELALLQGRPVAAGLARRAGQPGTVD